MVGTQRALARVRAMADRGARHWRGRLAPPPMEAAARPPVPPVGRKMPFIGRAPQWPPVQHTLDLDEFALLPEDLRATIAAIVEPALQRLGAAVAESLAQRPRDAEPAQLVARAIAARTGELADLIRAVDRFNAAPGSRYRVQPRLKLFLIECAIGEVADRAAQFLARTPSANVALAA
jgi:hypothetical protein